MQDHLQLEHFLEAWEKKPAYETMHGQTAQLESPLLNNQHMNQSINNVPIINQKPIHIAPVPFLVGMFGFSL